MGLWLNGIRKNIWKELLMTITSYIFLDDERDPKNVTWVEIPFAPWTVVRDYSEFVDVIQAHYNQFGKLPIHISFDHDLAHAHYRKSMYNPDRHYNSYYTDGTFKEKTGFHAAQWLVNFLCRKNLDIPEFTCHSMNPIGKENILSILQSYKKFRESS